MSTYSSLDNARPHLQQVRSAFLRLHKALLDSERVTYEQTYGRITSTGEYFRLVTGHKWFDWLRPMSQFIVQMDDILGAKEEPMTLEQAQELLQTARSLTQPNEEGTPREQRYYEAIQRDPNIALMHAETSQLLTSSD